MNRLRSSGSLFEDTCSAETTVPWMTRMCRPAPTAAPAYRAAFCGVTLAAVTMSAERISSMRGAISSGFTGS